MIDLHAVKAKWVLECPGCEGRSGAHNRHPTGNYVETIRSLVTEVECLREEIATLKALIGGDSQ